MTTRAAELGRRASHAPLACAAVAAGVLALLACLPLALLGQAGSGAAPAGARPTAVPASGRAAVPLPAAAREPISAAIGAARAPYRISGSATEALARNPTQHLSMRFTPSGVRVNGPGSSMALSLRAIGYRGRLEPAGQARLRVRANRVTYVRPALEEWYVNGPLGLEQGFTLEHAPAGGAPGTLTLALALAGNGRAELTQHGRGFVLHSAHARTIAYGDLLARDASGRRLASWLTLRGGSLSLHVGLAHARFPVRIDPLITGGEGEVELEREPSEPGETPFKDEFFGASVALSGDGNTAIVGAPGEGARPGKAWVFVRQGSVWVEQQQIAQPTGTGVGEQECEPSPTELSPCVFGSAVALSGDGDVALIADPTVKPGPGAVFVYTRGGTSATWSQAAELTAPDKNGARGFGESVALTADGETALVGAPEAHAGAGEAWAFASHGGEWPITMGQTLEATEPSKQRRLGQSVAISADGETAILGAPEENNRVGAAFTFVRGTMSWHQAQKLTGEGESPEGLFGASVAISPGGETAIVGAPRDHGSIERSGAAWVFTLAHGSSLQPPVKLAGIEPEGTPEEGIGEEFGAAVALASNGTSALVGAPHYDGKVGQVWLFSHGESGWGTPTAITYETESNKQGRFGTSVAISSDAQTVLAGSPHSYEKEGAAWLFGPRPLIASVTPNRGPPTGGTPVTIKGNNFGEVQAVLFGKTPAARFEVVGPETIIAYSPAGTGEVQLTLQSPRWQDVIDKKDRFNFVEKGGGGDGGKGEETPPGGKPQGPSPPLLTGIIVANEPKFGVLGSSSHSGACAVRSKTSTVAVTAGPRAQVTLVASGNGRCAGRLAVRVQVKAGSRTRTESVGSVSYSLLAGHSERLSVKLDALARTLLGAHHGRLKATLLFARTQPRPAKATAASITLARHA